MFFIPAASAFFLAAFILSPLELDLYDLHSYQAVADPFGFGVRKQLRKSLGTHQPPEQRDDQRLLNRVCFNVILHVTLLIPAPRPAPSSG